MNKLATLCVATGALFAMGCSAEYGGEEYSEDGEVREETQEVMNGDAVSSGDGAINIVTSSGSCTGAIIGPRSFITAAHCLNSFGYGDKEVNVRVNYYDSNQWWCLSESSTTSGRCTRTRKGDAWINPAHDAVKNSSNKQKRAEQDFAVVTMRQDFSYIRSAHKMSLMEAPVKSAIDTFRTIGYGRIGDNTSNNLPFQAHFLLDTVGTRYYYSAGESGSTGEQLCSGDSGSPQFEPRSVPLVFGVHSGRDPVNGGCGEAGTKQYGALVAPYIDEIEDNIGYACRHYNDSTYGPIADCWQ